MVELQSLGGSPDSLPLATQTDHSDQRRLARGEGARGQGKPPLSARKAIAVVKLGREKLRCVRVKARVWYVPLYLVLVFE